MSVEVRTVGNQRQSAYGARAGDACAHSNFLEKGPRERNRTIVDNDLERRNYDGNRVVTQSLTDGFLLTITLWRDMDNVGSSGFSRNFGSWSSVVSRSHSWRALIFSESSCSCFPTVSVCEINVRSQKLIRVTWGRQIIRRLRLAIILLHVSTTPFTSRLSVEVTLLQFMSGKNFPERDCSYTMWWFLTEQLIPCNLDLSNQWTSPANLELQRPALVDPCIIVATRRPVPACLGKPTAVGSMIRSNLFHMHRCKSCFYLLK
jgi:hypothetical protein